jgi:hypothetical protein
MTYWRFVWMGNGGDGTRNIHITLRGDEFDR